MIDDEYKDVPLLPVVRQPKGVQYILGTWSGRILLINTLIFVWMIYRDPSSLFVPSLEFVRAFGSKSVADIARGEYWRYLTPMFVHIGVIHFFFNAMGLYYIGYQIEHILGKRWFLAVYMVSGIMGNLASCVFSLAPSAGASGALFGLLGAGFRLEGLISDAFDRAGVQAKPRKRIYTGMVVTNIVLGLVIPVIDNAAHIGGLVAGWLLMEALLRIRPNRLRIRNKPLAVIIFAGIASFSIFAVARTSDPVVVVNRYYQAAIAAGSAPDAYRDFSEVLRVKPLHVRSRLLRGKLLLQNGETRAGINDIKIALSTGQVTDDMAQEIVTDLQMTGHRLEAEIVLRLKSGQVPEDI